MKNNVFIFIIIVSCCCCCCTCVAAASVDSSSIRLRKLLITTTSNSSTSNQSTNNPQVSPVGSPAVNHSYPNPNPNPNPTPTKHNNNNQTQVVVVAEEESQLTHTKNNTTKTPPRDSVNTAAAKQNDNTTHTLTYNASICQESLTTSICRDNDITACILPSKHGSTDLFLVVLNGGESTLKVNVSLPNQLENPILVLEVPTHELRRVRTESRNVGKSSELIVSSASAKCVLTLVRPVSVENFIQQVSFYSRQVTPIYVAYTLFVLVLLFGGTWACCKFRKKNRHDGNGIPYQEIEMGLPDTVSAVNVDAAEGWDHDWDNDDWDAEETVRAPGAGGHISKDGLTSRSSKTGGWENDWDD